MAAKIPRFSGAANAEENMGYVGFVAVYSNVVASTKLRARAYEDILRLCIRETSLAKGAAVEPNAAQALLRDAPSQLLRFLDVDWINFHAPTLPVSIQARDNIIVHVIAKLASPAGL
nr:hypothetical protein Iba_chr04aCG7450 [Ipomoea batatas]